MLFVLIAALLALPAVFGGPGLGTATEIFGFVSSTLLMAGALGLLLNSLFWILLALVFLVRCTWSFTLHFSGEGFTPNFFDHVNLTSAQIGFREYPVPLILLGAVFGLIAWGLHRVSARTKPGGSAWLALAGSAFLAGLLVLAPVNGPERLFATGYAAWHQLLSPGQLSRADRSLLEASGRLQLDHNGRQSLHASAGPERRNLVLIYLESFQLAFTDEGPLPRLTPGLNELKHEFGNHPDWLSSANATMEALISTMCGALIASPHGGNTFGNTEAVLPGLACLPDVLKAAGYYQVYLGGFDKAFSGKGAFMLGHGFDEAWGWEEWQGKGYVAPDGFWGLPDYELFEEALQRVETLLATDDRQPFNLTLLTLGTHPPGFLDPTCTPLEGAGAGERIMEAIHCTDQLVSHFVGELRSRGLLDNTTIVITGDHDMFHLPGLAGYFPGMDKDPRLLTIVIAPGGKVEWPPGPAAAYDLAPTVLDLLGVRYDTRFTWGRSAFSRNSLPVTRNFRVLEDGSLHFLPSSHPACDDRTVPLDGPLDDCAQLELLRLSDQYLAGFSGAAPVSRSLCEAGRPFEVTIGGAMPLSLQVDGEQLADRFAEQGRPMQPDKPGCYLFVKASERRAASYSYYKPDHPAWQVWMLDFLLGLDPREQFVLAYQPDPADGEVPEAIAPLVTLLRGWGLATADLQRPFVIASRVLPGQDQAFGAMDDGIARLALDASQCEALAEPLRGDASFDLTEVERQLAPLLETWPWP